MGDKQYPREGMMAAPNEHFEDFGHNSENGHIHQNGSIEPNGIAPEKSPTFGQRMKAHFRRFWWIHLILFIVIGIVLTIILLYVVFPKIAQSQIRRASLDLVSEEVTNPEPNQLQLKLTAQANNPSPYHPRLSSFNASLYLPDTLDDPKPFAYVTVPEVIAAKHVNITVQQPLQIVDMDQFNRYSLQTLQSETYSVVFDGNTRLHEMSFPVTSVNFKTEITTQGLNGLKDLTISDLNLHLIPLQPNGANADGTITVTNPSKQAIFFGNVTADLYCDGQLLGNATIPNFQLNPGVNNVSVSSSTNQVIVLSLVAQKYTNGVLPVQIVGTSVVNNGQHIPYFEQALSQNVVSTNLNVAGAVFKFALNGTALNSTFSTLVPGTLNLSALASALGGLLTPAGIDPNAVANAIGVNVTAVNEVLAGLFGSNVTLQSVASSIGAIIAGNK